MKKVQITIDVEERLLDALRAVYEAPSDQVAVVTAIENTVREHEARTGRPAGSPLSAHMVDDCLQLDPVPDPGRKPV